MLVRSLCFSAAVGASLLLGCGSGTQCSDGDADDPAQYSTIAGHVQTTTAILTTSTFTWCVNGACQQLAQPSAPGNDPDYPTPTFADLGDGWLVVDYQVASAELVDGDTFRFSIVTATGDTLLDVTRTVAFGPSYENACGSFTPTSGIFDLYPSSLSGQTCEANGVASLVTLKGNFGDAAITDASTVKVCLNASCQSGTFTTMDTYAPYVAFGSGGTAAVGYGVKVVGAGAYTVTFEAPPELLADGDVYSVTLDDGSAYSGRASVTYTTSYPDGKQCDALPQRTATVTLAAK